MKYSLLLFFILFEGCCPKPKMDILRCRFIQGSMILPVKCLHKYNQYKINDSCWVDGVTWEITRDKQQLHEEIHGNREKMIIVSLTAK